jgi:hypothetical protein
MFVAVAPFIERMIRFSTLTTNGTSPRAYTPSKTTHVSPGPAVRPRSGLLVGAAIGLPETQARKLGTSVTLISAPSAVTPIDTNKSAISATIAVRKFGALLNFNPYLLLSLLSFIISVWIDNCFNMAISPPA